MQQQRTHRLYAHTYTHCLTYLVGIKDIGTGLTILRSRNHVKFRWNGGNDLFFLGTGHRF